MRDAKEDILLFNLYIAQMQVNFVMDVVLLSGYNHVRAGGEMTKRKYYKSFWGGLGIFRLWLRGHVLFVKV